MPVSPNTDLTPLNAVLSRVAGGDTGSFRDLYQRIAPNIYGLCHRVIVDPSHSEEVTQEILLEIWRRAPRFDPARGSALSWMMTIAHSRAVDRVRSSQSSRRRDTAYLLASTVRDTDVVIDAILAAAKHDLVAQALASLSSVQRQAITLAYYEGFTQHQIAELLDVPLGTVKSRVRDGMLQLRKQLTKQPDVSKVDGQPTPSQA